MKKIRNAFIWITVIFLGIYFMKTLVFNSKDNEEKDSRSKTTSQNPTQPQTSPLVLKPWTFNRQTTNPKNNTRMDWSIPTTGLTEPTEWFNVENVSYWGYRVKSDCLVEYKFKDPTKTPVMAKMEWKTSNHYTNGTADLWTTEKLLEVVDSATEIRFLPLPSQSLIGPTVYRSE